MGVGVYGCVHIVAIGSPAAVLYSAEGRICAEVLHSLNEGDETGEQAHEAISRERTWHEVQCNLQCL